MRVNSVAILDYCSVCKLKLASVMGWHCDSTYTSDYSRFKSNAQAWKPHVIIVTYGVYRIQNSKIMVERQNLA